MRVLSEVGASHHLVHHEVENCARIVGNGELARFRWWEDRALAVAAFEACRRGGVATCVGIAPFGSEVSINAGELVYGEKRFQGSYYGTARPHSDVPRLLDLFMAGRLPLDRLLTRRYGLEDVNTAYEALLHGEVARSVLIP